MNQHQKRDWLPGADLIRAASEPIQVWWRRAYLDGSVLQQRFEDEVRASLPGLGGVDLTSLPEEVFAALQMRQLRLRHDQQVPEWAGLVAATSLRPADRTEDSTS